MLFIFDATCIVLKSGWNYTARMPRLVVISSLVLPDEHPPTSPPSTWPAFITLPTLATSFTSFGALSVVLHCSPPASSSTPLWQLSVYYPTISLIVNTIYIRTFSDHLNVLYFFDPTCSFDIFYYYIPCPVLCTIICDAQQQYMRGISTVTIELLCRPGSGL